MEPIASRRVYDGRVVNLRVDTLAGEHGPHDVEVVEHRGAVVVIVRPSPGEMILVQQYRHAVGATTWEVCAGGMDPGESPHDAALRELREETGFLAKTMRHLWSAYSAPGFCTELLHFFETDSYDRGETDFDENEQIEIATFTIDHLWHQMQRNELQDAKTQIAVLWALTQSNAR